MKEIMLGLKRRARARRGDLDLGMITLGEKKLMLGFRGVTLG